MAKPTSGAKEQMMGRNIEEIIAALPKQRRNRINRSARKMAGEMVAHADSLAAIRKAFKKTQAEIAAALGLAQNAAHPLDGRRDMRSSTLGRDVDAPRGEHGVVIRLKAGAEVGWRPTSHA